jgi:hypothetical protein
MNRRSPIAEDIRSFLAHAWKAARRHGLEISAEPDPETMNAVLVANAPGSDRRTGALYVSWGIDGHTDPEKTGPVLDSCVQLSVRLVYDHGNDACAMLFWTSTRAEWRLIDHSHPTETDAPSHDRVVRHLDPDGLFFGAKQGRISPDDAFAIMDRMYALCAADAGSHP